MLFALNVWLELLNFTSDLFCSSENAVYSLNIVHFKTVFNFCCCPPVLLVRDLGSDYAR